MFNNGNAILHSVITSTTNLSSVLECHLCRFMLQLLTYRNDILTKLFNAQ